jgi:hypothetical protein
VTPPPEEELASDSEAIFRQELADSLQKSASESAHEAQEVEEEVEDKACTQVR